MSALFEKFLEKLQGVKRTSTGWVAKCPAHEDKRASLSTSVSASGKVLIKCHAGCAPNEVLHRLGLQWEDLFPGKSKSSNRRRTIEKVYDYTDERGNLLFQVVRFAPKGFAQRRVAAHGGYDWGLGKTRRIPYRLPEVLQAAQAGKVVLVCEGEKDVETAEALGFVATTSPAGASNWRQEFAEYFRGAALVAVVPDRDKAGLEFAQDVAEACRKRTIPVRVVELPLDYKETGGPDLTDWVSDGATSSDLKDLIRNTQDWTPLKEAPRIEQLHKGDGWPDIIPLGQGRLMDFPVTVLPDPLARWVLEEAESTQTPLALAGMVAIAVAALAISGKVQLQAKSGFLLPLNLYIAVAMPPGARKSTVLADACKPLEEWEEKQALELGPEIEASKVKKDVLEGLAKKAKQQAMSGGENANELMDRAIRAQQDGALYKPTLAPRLLCDDITPEALASLLSNHGKIGVFSAEGGIFETMAGRYQNGVPNIDVYLKGWSGDTIRVDRVSRLPEFIRDPALNMCLAIQPEVVRSLSAKPGFRGRGLVGRFLYALPESNLGQRTWTTPSMQDSTLWAYKEAIRNLLQMQKAPDDQALRLSPEAEPLVAELHDHIEKHLADFSLFSGMTDWGSKFHGSLLRIAGVFHCLEQKSRRPWEVPISPHVIERVAHLSEFLADHAIATYGEFQLDESEQSALHLWSWITKKGGQRFTRRDAHIGCRGDSRFKRSNQLDGPLSTLIEHGYIRAAKERKQGRGRRSETYETNPNAPDSPNFVHFVKGSTQNSAQIKPRENNDLDNSVILRGGSYAS